MKEASRGNRDVIVRVGGVRPGLVPTVVGRSGRTMDGAEGPGNIPPFARDIRERKKLEEARRAGEAKFNSDIKNAPVGTPVLDESGFVVEDPPKIAWMSAL